MEEIITVAIVFGSALAALKLILDFVHAKRGSKGGADRSLTTTELSDMIDEAVAQSVGRLEKRIENLEAIAVDQPMLPEHRESGRLELPDETSDTTSAAGQRVRSRQ